MGILNLPCRIDYTRATANSITYADVVGMFARAKLGGNLVWVASQTCIPQLATIRDAGSNNLWIQNATTGVPSKMLGFDILWNDRSPVLGTTGDLALVDLDYYLIKDGSGPRVDVSTEFLFQNDETAFRIVWFVDGQSWLNEPIPLEGSTANTVSPFVILKSA
jgi:HK97 family phage major capsid protein